jgi:hypothetical protein
MLDAKRLLLDAICVIVLVALMIWGATAIATVPETLPPTIADCDKPSAPPKEVTTAGGLPGLNLADCGDAKPGGSNRAEEPPKQP